MTPEAVDRIARAVLYEGYLLYPYRGSALKNRHRWNFGVLFPPRYAAECGGAETSAMATECVVVGGPATRIGVGLRCLELGVGCGASAADSGAVERRFDAPPVTLGAAGAAPCRAGFSFSGASGAAVEGAIELSAALLEAGCYRLHVRAANTTALRSAPATRDDALEQALLSVHLTLQAAGGEFVSSLDPLPALSDAVNGCSNAGLWPVLVGEQGRRDWMLAAPIILYDYPEIAPESPGDLFDGTEIDELLTLRILTLTDEEKRQLRAGDPRARQILERSETLPAEQLRKLHGALRRLGRDDRSDP